MPDFSIPPILLDNAARADMTANCRDCDQIPKVPDSGKVVSFRDRRVQIMHNGVRVIADGYYGEWMSRIFERLLFVASRCCRQEEAVFHEVMKHVPPDATMLELGGFWSYYSLWFKSQHRDRRRAFVVEPDPNHLSVGRINAGLNNQEIIFLQACIGAEPASAVGFTTETALRTSSDYLRVFRSTSLLIVATRPCASRCPSLRHSRRGNRHHPILRKSLSG